MDSLIADPIPSLSKKRRRLSSQNNPKDATNAGIPVEPGSSPKGSPPKPFSFYKDVIDEKLEQRVDSSDSNQNEENEDDVFICDTNSEDLKHSVDPINHDLDEERSHTNIDISVPDISLGPSISFRPPIPVISDRNSPKIKGILCYVKKGAKKSVRSVSRAQNCQKMVKHLDCFCSFISIVIKNVFLMPSSQPLAKQLCSLMSSLSFDLVFDENQ